MAVISAMPAPTAVTNPVESTVATSLSSLDHAKVTPPIMVPSEVRATAMSWCVSPISSITGIASTITTASTSGAISSTVTVAGILVTPLVAAVIIAVPAATAVTSPVSSTVATSVSSLIQVNSTSSITMPSSVMAVAMNWNMPPTMIIIEAGLTVTVDTTGSGGGASATLIVTGELEIPSAVARIMAEPAPTAVATPPEVMVTTLVSLLAQVILTSSRTVPPAVRAMAVKVTVSPTINS